MNKLFLVLIAFPLLTACGIRTVEHKKVNIDPELQPYVTQFQLKSGISIDNLEVVFRSLGPNGEHTYGYCQQSSRTVYTDAGLTRNEYNTPLIVINSDHWNSDPYVMNSAGREALLFHELGHCILHRDHSESYSSIMYPYLVRYWHYTQNYASYISELFGYTSYAGTFDENTYASTRTVASSSIKYPEFEEPEIKTLTSDDLEDGCTHKSHEVIHEEENHVN